MKNLTILVISIICLLSVSTIFGFQVDGKSKNGVAYSIRWKIIPATSASKKIRFTIVRNTTIGLATLPPSGRKEYLTALFKYFVTPHWFSLALNSQSQKITMRNSDMIFVRNIESGFECAFSDQWSDAKGRPPKADTEFGGREDWSFISADLQLHPNEDLSSGGSVLSSSCTIERQLVTDDPYDTPITNKYMVLGWAHGDVSDDGHPRKHEGTVEQVQVNLITGKLFDQNSDKSSDLFFWHAVLMTTAWLVLMIPATFLARFMKSIVPTWYFIHYRMQILSFLLFLAAIFVAAVELDWQVPFDNHVIVGFTIFSLVVLQGVLGYLSNAFWYEGKPPRWWPDKLHWWMGRLIILGGLVNIVLGVESMQDKDFLHDGIGWSWPYMLFLGYFGFLTVSVLVFEVRVGQQHEHLMQSVNLDDDQSITGGDQDDSSDSDVESVTDLMGNNTSNINKNVHSSSMNWSLKMVRLFSFLTLTILVLLAVSFLITIFFA